MPDFVLSCGGCGYIITAKDRREPAVVLCGPCDRIMICRNPPVPDNGGGPDEV